MQKHLLVLRWVNRYSTVVGLMGLVVVAAVMRFWKLGTLPPGLSISEARFGESVAALINHGQLPSFTAFDSYSPLMVAMQALPLKLLGPSTWSLRLVPAMFGVLAVVALWFWGRAWFGDRIAWIAAFLMAVSPWAVSLSRNVSASALIMLLVPLTFWLTTVSYRRNEAKLWLFLGVVLGLDMLAGPIAQVAVGLVLFTGIIWLVSSRQMPGFAPACVAALIIAACLAAGAGYLVAVHPSGFATLPGQLGLPAGAAAIFATVVSALLMFNVRGDANFAHNLGGEPLLNIFVGMMFIAGLLVAATRIGANRYRRLLLVFVVFLIPAMLSVAGAPNAARAVGVLPVTMLLAAIGISYLLQLWYSTFPINSAARVSGQSAVGLLLLLTAFQGYTQYFHAWAGSAETYATYNEAAVGASNFTDKAAAKSKVNRFLVVANDEIPVAEFLTADTSGRVIQATQLTGMPVTPGTYDFVLTTAARQQTVKALADKFPGGKLKPYYSNFNDSDIFYDYQVTK